MSGKVLLQRAQVALHFFIVFLHFLFFLGHRFFSTQSPFKHCFAHFLDFQTSLAASVGSEQAASTASMSNGGTQCTLTHRCSRSQLACRLPTTHVQCRRMACMQEHVRQIFLVRSSPTLEPPLLSAEP